MQKRLVWSVLVLFVVAVLASVQVSSVGVWECNNVVGDTSSGLCSSLQIPTAGGACTACNIRTYCDDWPEGREVCNVTDATCTAGCGECQVDDHCTEGSNLICSLGECVECTGDNNCSLGEFCSSGVCVDCNTDADCSNNEVCVAGACLSCRNDDDCDVGEICSAGGSCTQCNNNNDCNSNLGEFCFNGVCGTCHNDSECQSGYICQLGSYTCVANFSVNKTYWANMNNVEISSANEGDTVRMVFGGNRLENQTVNYTIQELNNSFVWYNPLTWFGSVEWNTANKLSSGDAYVHWTVLGLNKKRFIATAGSSSNVSGNLSVNGGVNNSVPNITQIVPLGDTRISIKNLEHGEPSNLIWFRQTTYDEDDLLNITWDFGDGDIATFNNYYSGSNSSDIQHGYSNPGIYYWTLTVREMNREHVVSVSRRIFVFKEGINVMPVITSPEDEMAYGDSLIVFNGTQSYVVNCTSTNGQLSEPSNGFLTTDRELRCIYLHAPNTTNTDGYKLTANWTLDDSEGDAYRVGLWNETSVDGRRYSDFSYLYRSNGIHNIKLKLTYED